MTTIQPASAAGGVSPITTHALDTASGLPASGLDILLQKRNGDAWTDLTTGTTNGDGRLPGLLKVGDARYGPGVYRMTFNTGKYFADRNLETFYPTVKVVFEIKDPALHYHVPLLVSPFGYSTYRGS